MKLLESKNECCGCGVCANICKHKAISMIEDEKGFLYPIINEQKCVNCGLCLNVCDFKKEHNCDDHILSVYAMQHKSKDVIKNSSSGGAFTALSDYILSLGGYIYGAVYDEDFRVHHIGTNKVTVRNKMRGSKYVQSAMGTVYIEIAENLKKGIPVLFTGMPCQCASLLSYLGKTPSNLYIIDLLCHGVPSNLLLREHINFWERRTAKKIVDYQYRSKKYGYEYSHRMIFSDGTDNSTINIKRLLKLYDKTMRPSCHNCKYTSRNRYSDITIGDLWEAGSIAKIYDHRGTSVLIVNSKKGKRLLNSIESQCNLREIDKDELKQDALSKPVPFVSSNEELWKDYLENGYEYILNKYAPYTIKTWGYATLWRILYYTHLDSLAVYLLSKKK